MENIDLVRGCQLLSEKNRRTPHRGSRLHGDIGLVSCLSWFAALAFAASAAQATPPADLDKYAVRAMQSFGPPGMAVAIVEGEKIYTRAYGVRKLDTPERVDEHTTFPIGSNTKAFTSSALAILVDRKSIAWDDRVADRLPGFQMYDAYASHEMTIRDLLTHRSGLGLGEGDLLFTPATRRSRADVVRALRFLQPATSFRSVFAYDNILYTVAGQLIEAVSGQSWETFVTKNIFGPVGMHDSAVSYAEQGPNHVAPHARTSQTVRGVGPLSVLTSGYEGGAAAPAGAIYSSAADMALWLRVQLREGALENGQRLFSGTAAKELRTPQTVIPIAPVPPAVAAIQPNFQEYSLGFFIQDYRGHKVITHSGAILGGLSALVIVPEKNVAFAVMINSEDSGARWSVFYHLLDSYLGLPPIDWPAQFRQAFDKIHADALAAVQPKEATHPERGPSLPMGSYVGVYRDPWYGTATISNAGNTLRIRFDETPGMEGALEHVQYDTFRTRWSDRDIEDAYVSFSLDPSGAISAVKLQPVSPTADFSFDYQDLHFVPDNPRP
jgi:CubicO group peptidase (beta-lactamase class C family)